MAWNAEEAVTQVIKKLHLHKTDHNFSLYINDEYSLRISWDGAGLLHNGSLVLIEAEMCDTINEEHIRNHIINLLVMCAKQNTKIHSLVWIVYPHNALLLKEIIERFIYILKNIIKTPINIPNQKIMNPYGDILYEIS